MQEEHTQAITHTRINLMISKSVVWALKEDNLAVYIFKSMNKDLPDWLAVVGPHYQTAFIGI